MAVLGELAVNVVAKTKQFVKGMSAAKKGLKGFTTSLKTSVKSVTDFASAITGIGVGLSAAGLAAAFNQTAASIDKLAKSSRKLGVATEELQALQLAAERNGIAADQFAISLQRMTRRISDAARGTGVLVPVLERMNLTAEQLVDLNPAEQFELINAELAKVPQADRIATAFAFFDSEGVNNINLAGQNLAKYRQELQELGKAVTTDEAARVEEMNDSLARLSDSFSGALNRVVIDMAPHVAESVDALLEAYKEIQREQQEERAATGSTREGRPGFFSAPISSTGYGIGAAVLGAPILSRGERMFSRPDQGILEREKQARTAEKELKTQTSILTQIRDELGPSVKVEIGQ